MTDGKFLFWLTERLVHVYKESPNVDFVQKLREIAMDTRTKEIREEIEIAASAQEQA